jgi:F-type H+-transporting ATPase subunit gamma
MKFVSTSKLRKAQERVFAARPYANRMLAVLNSLATRVDPNTHPLLKERDSKNVMLLVVTADKGLCGAFNSNLIRSAVQFIDDESINRSISLALVGKKGVDWFKNRPWPIRHQYLSIMSRVDFAYAQEIGHHICKYYAEAEIDAIFLLYNEFKSVVSQKVVAEPLLPIKKLEPPEEGGVFLDYIYEQPPTVLFERLLERHVETQIFRAMLESEAAEHAARMTAMDAATRNSKEMIEALTLHINRVRQASITTEIIEIVSGANALEELRSE